MLTAGISFGSWGVGTASVRRRKQGAEDEWGGRRKGERQRGREAEERGREREGECIICYCLSAFFAIVNPLEMEISHINMHCIIPSSQTNCFCELVLYLKRHTDEGYGENVK